MTGPLRAGKGIQVSNVGRRVVEYPWARKVVSHERPQLARKGRSWPSTATRCTPRWSSRAAVLAASSWKL
jgi:hypothetical protein